jgi:hypothetical protein
VEGGTRGCFYFFWYRSEATVRGMDWASDSSLEKLLQSLDQTYCNVDAWIDTSIYGIHSTSKNTTPCGCYSNFDCINVCVPWGGWLEHYGTSKRDDNSNSKRDWNFPFAWWELSRETWWCRFVYINEELILGWRETWLKYLKKIAFNWVWELNPLPSAKIALLMNTSRHFQYMKSWW